MNVFFDKYDFNAARARLRQTPEDAEARFTCQLYNKVGS